LTNFSTLTIIRSIMAKYSTKLLTYNKSQINQVDEMYYMFLLSFT